MRFPGFSSRRGLHSLAGAYALDALDDVERTLFERHLRGCRSCTVEVHGFAATTTALALAVAAPPPASLKARVLGEVAVLSAARELDEEIAAVLSAPDALIASGATSAGGTATVVASPRGGTMVFTSTGLPELPSSRVYELWFIGSGGIRPAGLVPAVARSGSTAPVFASGLAGGDAVGVTVEPAGGSPAPTTTPIVVLALAA